MKKQDSFVKLFDKFLSNENDCEVKKNIQYDKDFIDKISEHKTGKSQLYKNRLSDKLYMF